jgi:hypothetical protein
VILSHVEEYLSDIGRSLSGKLILKPEKLWLALGLEDTKGGGARGVELHI